MSGFPGLDGLSASVSKIKRSSDGQMKDLWGDLRKVSSTVKRYLVFGSSPTTVMLSMDPLSEGDELVELRTT